MTFRSPLIAIVGATGTGKSQLAVTLAERFNGEIINADALQMYAGLPITTNKIPIEERKGIAHHLLGCINLEEEPWTVGNFVLRAGNIIQEIRARGKVPIIVGGTHYYTQSLLFKESILDTREESNGSEVGYMTTEEQEQKWPILAGSGAEMLAELQNVDPEMARKWHPSNTRKIRRSLEIWLKTGRKASEIYREQRNGKQDRALHNETADVNSSAAGTSENSGQTNSPLRYNVLILWIHAEPPILKSRLNARVKTMIASGLLSEVQSMRSLYSLLQTSPGRNTDLTRGIWVAIGYKDFAEYFSALEQGEVDEKRLAALEKDAVERTQAATRQYAKNQVRWIRLRLLKALRGVGDVDCRNFYVLDGTDPEQFAAKVEKTAGDLAASFLSGNDMPDPISTSDVAEKVLSQNLMDLKEGKALEEEQMERECSDCHAILVTPNDWKQHLRSKGHKWQVKHRRKEKLEKGRESVSCSRNG